MDFTGLIGTEQPQTTPTLAQRKDAFAKGYLGAIQQQFAQRVQAFNDLYAAIWRNSQLTPKQAIASLGTQAKTLFTLCAMEAQYINTIKPSTVNGSIPEGFEITFEADGSLKDLVEAA